LDDGQANGGDDQYDGVDYDKELQQKNDIHLAEGEDEGEGNVRIHSTVQLIAITKLFSYLNFRRGRHV